MLDTGPLPGISSSSSPTCWSSAPSVNRSRIRAELKNADRLAKRYNQIRKEELLHQPSPLQKALKYKISQINPTGIEKANCWMDLHVRQADIAENNLLEVLLIERKKFDAATRIQTRVRGKAGFNLATQFRRKTAAALVLQRLARHKISERNALKFRELVRRKQKAVTMQCMFRAYAAKLCLQAKRDDFIKKQEVGRVN